MKKEIKKIIDKEIEMFEDLMNRRPTYDFGDEQYLRKAEAQKVIKSFFRQSLIKIAKATAEAGRVEEIKLPNIKI